MPGSARFRPETTLISSLGTPYTVASSPVILVPASKVTGIQRVGVYKLLMIATAAVNFQFQDTSNNVLGASIPLAAAVPFFLDMPINGDPWWQTGHGPSNSIGGTAYPAPALPIGVGLQLALTGTGPLTADIWVGLGN